jgi:biopolymer transport protein ExbD
MLKRPSSRRKSKGAQIQLNLVPVLDTMVTLIGFLLFTMSFLSLVTIESPFPEASTEIQEQKLKERPLQLTLTLRDKESELWSPFEKVPSKVFPHLDGGAPDFMAIHQALVAIKQRYPSETQVVFVPFAGVNYETLIAAMDTMRTIEPTDPAIYMKNAATGVDEAVKALFPNVIFGNLLGDS